ncbi:hypothetical protein ACTACQ_05255 [Pseudomonas syringae]|uniref:hypothetical protein n=1 Tax=Pseudomonas syringae TaxID=317 RepID=UPI003F7B1D42
MSDEFSKALETLFDAWIADDSTHWVGDQDAAWQAWMYVNKQIVEPLNIQNSQLKAENAGLKTGYEAYERVNAELNQRIANLELCQTASLGVSGIIKSAASEQGFDAAGEDSALDYLIGLARSAAALRAECETLRNRQSFSDAFYEVSGLLGVAGARPEAPLVVFRQEVVPALQAVIRNSKRYEWLKQNATVMLKKTVSYTTSLGLMQTCYPSAMEVDAALDAAMSEEQSHD